MCIRDRFKFSAKLKVNIHNMIGSLGDLSTVIGSNNSNIRNLKITDRTDSFFKLDIEIDVIDLDHLKKILVSLRTSEKIINVFRV